MNESICGVEALMNAEDCGLLEPWGFEQFEYTVVEDSYEQAIVEKVASVLNICDAQSINTICALVTALEEGEKTTEQLAYELGFGTRLPLLQPFIRIALEAKLIQRVDSADKTQEYWKIVNE